MRTRRYLSVLLFASLLLAGQPTAPARAIGTTRYAAPGGLTSGLCKSWISACDLQRAISEAVSGDKIWAKEGTYYPGSSPSDTFTLKNGVGLYGGFAGTETLLKKRNPQIHWTILSGDIGVLGSDGDNSYHVVTGSGTNKTAVLDGFLVKYGRANGAGDPDNRGGGMYISAGNPTLSNVEFWYNSATYGGGLYSNAGSPTLSKVRFEYDAATENGGGIYVEGGSPSLTDVIFYGNGATSYGGGLYCQSGGTLTLSKVLFFSNTAHDGGGMSMVSCTAGLTNVTSYVNSATVTGGGMYSGSSVLHITNATFAYNGSGVDGGGDLYNDNTDPDIKDSIFWGSTSPAIKNSSGSSTPTVVDSIVQGGYPGGTHIVNSDPLLAGPADNGGYSDTLALGAGSPAIDSGGQSSTCAKIDQRGVKRPQGPACDMGAYEAPVTRTYRSSGSLDGWVLESREHSNVGGTLNKTAGTIRLGDDASRKQYRSILSFGTATLPDHASIVSAQLVFKYADVTPPASDPMLALGGLKLDMRKGFFGTSTGLEAADWQAAGNKTIGPFYPVPDAEYYTVDLSSSTFGSINRLSTNGGVTQIRLRFTLDDNDDAVANMLSLISGNDATATNRPTLIIVYTTP